MTSSGLGRLKDKVVIITGAGAGYGQGIVEKFTAEGAKVVAVDVNEQSVKATAEAAPKGTCVGIKGDVSSEADWRNNLQTAIKHFGKLDVVVNNAGVVHNAAPSHEVPEEQFELMFKVNVRPLYLSTKVIVPHWKENKREGLFINLSSISEPRPRPNLVWYAASKGAVTVATRGLAVEYAQDKIRYNCIRPAVGETAMLPKVLGGFDTPEGRQRVLGTIPLGRVSQPEDIANVACFMASDEAAYMDGACIDIDGGRGV